MYSKLQTLVSAPRLSRFKRVCQNLFPNKSEVEIEILVVKLYFGNILLSKRLYSILSMFEVVLRNKIDIYYRSKFNSHNWLFESVQVNGFLNSSTTVKTKEVIQTEIRKHNSVPSVPIQDRLVANLSFGTWRYMFSRNEFRAAGAILLDVFPSYQFDRSLYEASIHVRLTNPNTILENKRKKIFNHLDMLNKIRNRISHSEPICFHNNNIDICLAKESYETIIILLQAMDIDHGELLATIDSFDEEIKRFNLILM